MLLGIVPLPHISTTALPGKGLDKRDGQLVLECQQTSQIPRLATRSLNRTAVTYRQMLFYVFVCFPLVFELLPQKPEG